jgi:hypothetical protein
MNFNRFPELDAVSRERDPQERPREGNDPRRPDTRTAYYRGPSYHWAKTLILVIPFLAVLGALGFIVFNLVTG